MINRGEKSSEPSFREYCYNCHNFWKSKIFLLRMTPLILEYMMMKIKQNEIEAGLRNGL